eukprot:jgi/Tetstr1/438250/TSEL_026819.t1
MASVVNFMFLARGVSCRVRDVHVSSYNITMQVYREKVRAGRRGPGDLRVLLLLVSEHPGVARLLQHFIDNVSCPRGPACHRTFPRRHRAARSAALLLKLSPLASRCLRRCPAAEGCPRGPACHRSSPRRHRVACGAALLLKHEQDAPTDPTAPCVRCDGILRPPVALLSYYDFTAASRQALFDVLGTKSRANPNSPGAVEGASMVTVSVNYSLPLLKLHLAHVMEKVRAVQAKRLADLGRGATELFNHEHCRVMWCKMAEKYSWTFHTWDFLRFFLDFHGNVNVPDGKRAFENARQKATGDLHLIGMSMTLTLEIIEVGSKETSGAIHKLSFRFSTFAITAAQDEDGHVNLRMSAMHPSDLTDAGIDKSRWPHKPLYRQYAAYNELGARRLLRRNRRHMLPGASRDVLLEGSKHWDSTAAIASIGYYPERLAPAGAPAGTELNRANCGYKGRIILLQVERARDKFM